MYGVVGSYPDAYADITSASPVAYHALKGGIVQMTRHLAVYWAADGVRVNCLSPGPFPGEKADPRMVEAAVREKPDEAHGRAARTEGGGRLPGQRREQLHDGAEPADRRRLDGVVSPEVS